MKDNKPKTSLKEKILDLIRKKVDEKPYLFPYTMVKISGSKTKEETKK